MIDG
ncbi:hypothetical protein D030_1336A, partial [Vibrio parahaemolyticus AQ3810]|jgi:hypothetical protein